jgi:hypothetical protein
VLSWYIDYLKSLEEQQLEKGHYGWGVAQVTAFA